MTQSKDTNSPKTVAQFIAETKEADPELYAQAMREVEEQEQAETSKATLDTRLETVRDYLSPDGYYNGLGHAKTVQDARDEIERLRVRDIKLREQLRGMLDQMKTEADGRLYGYPHWLEKILNDD